MSAPPANGRYDPPAEPLIFLVAGEPSGDALGGRLMQALKAATGGRVRFAGVGGERMAAEGLESLFPLQDIAVMGFAEILPQVPVILRRLRQTVEAIRQRRPAAVVTIDAPAFCLRIAQRVRKTGIPVIHYVAPQLWAWRPRRVKKLIDQIDHLLLLLPFEPAFFADAGLTCTYVGHSVLEERNLPVAPNIRARHSIPAEAPVLLVLPGSRRGLVRRMLPVFRQTLDLLRGRHRDLHVFVPVVAGTADLVTAETRTWAAPTVVVQDPAEKRAAFATATAALTTSGTATLELAVAELPMVVTYRVNPVSGWLARHLIQVPHVAMPNLIAARAIVPELLQADCSPARIAQEVGRLLSDAEARSAQKRELSAVCDKLGREGASPSARAAAVVLDIIAKRAR